MAQARAAMAPAVLVLVVPAQVVLEPAQVGLNLQARLIISII